MWLAAFYGTLKINNMKRLFHYLALLSAGYFLYPEYALADTIPDSTQIHGIWNVAGSPYIIMGLATIPADSTLTIEPGVLVEFRSSNNSSDFNIPHVNIGWIKSFGNLVALGSETDSIIFTSMGEGNWGGMHFLNSYDTTRLKYCKIEKCQTIGNDEFNGESYLGGLTFKNADAIIEYSSLAHSRIGMAALHSDVVLNNNRINNNYSGVHYLESSGSVTSTYFSDNNDFGITTKYSSVYMENNEIELHSLGIFSYESFDTIVGNIIRNNFEDGIQIAYGNALVFRNTVYGNNYGIHSFGNPKIVNNTVVNNNFGIYCYHPVNLKIVNNIIYGNDVLISNYAGDTIVFANNLLQVDAVPPGLTDAGGNVFNKDPLFVDPDNGDFSLDADSPCINMGIAHFEWDGEIVLDLDPGEYIGGAPDMGAIESTYTGVESDLTGNEHQRMFVYPNPARGETIHLYCAESGMECDYLVIQNMMGSTFHQQEIHDTKCIINIKNWPAGIYLVVAFKNRKSIEQTKFVVL